MLTFPRYDVYQESNVAWIGEIPAHWDVAPGLNCYDKRKEINKGMVEDTVLSISYGRIVIRPPEKLTGLVPESFETYQLVDPGDIIIRTTDLQNDWNTLRTAIARDRGIITSAYLRLKAKDNINPEYLRLVLHTYDLLKVYYGMGSGLRQNLDYNGDFKRLPIILPPRAEQDRIVAFLDEKTAAIDDAIAKKRRLIELLQEQKGILINTAVTQGLDPNAPMKESGVEWIGRVPAHWEIKQGFLCYEKIKQLNTGMIENTVLSISYGRIVIKPPEKLTGLVPESFETYQLVDPGDIIIRPTDLQNDWNTLRTAIARDRGIITSAYLRLKAKGDINAEYLRLVLHTYDLLKVYYGMGSGLRQNLDYNKDFKRLPIIVPPRMEQDQIVHFLQEKDTETNEVIGKTRQEIDLLSEYRAILVSEAVTGKINV